ncbi:MAG: YjjG family noncanonical pyrimidine nucleotidase [Bacteroidales bacterium]|jgi:putative hydrolase of the HAD superfamily|nr:YjjG family noncanonical pyrimidine nucleotidase [Bacteroidales bacterium]
MLKKNYRYILFDLDRTLWDFNSNAKNNIFSLLGTFKLSSINKELFYQRYELVNHRLWALYEKGELPKESLRWERFHKTLLEFGHDNRELATDMGEEYLKSMPYQTILMPYALEVLTQLKRRECKMALISNGFKEVQYKKIENSGIGHFFDAVMISEEQGVHKPSPIIFKRALESINGVKSDSLMVGDDYANDIEGAMIFGIDQFFYSSTPAPYERGATYESGDLRDLLTFSPQQ